MNGNSRRVSGSMRALALVMLASFSVADRVEGVCSVSRPARYLWLEVLSCSDQVLREVSEESFRQALERTDMDLTRIAAREAASLVRQTPGLLIVGRVLAFADTDEPFSVREPSGKYRSASSDRPFEWRQPETEGERRYFFGSTHATCEALQADERIIVFEHFTCCDTGRSGAIGCILELPELRPSQKAPPTAAELSAAGIYSKPAPAAPEAATGSPKPR